MGEQSVLGWVRVGGHGASWPELARHHRREGPSEGAWVVNGGDVVVIGVERLEPCLSLSLVGWFD